MPFPFPILLLALPIIELTGLILVGEEYGAMNVVMWVILSIILGVYVIRMTGWVTARNLQESMRRGDVPFGAMFQAAGMVFAGIFLIIPGFLTDILGLLLLIAPVRNAIGRTIAGSATIHAAGMGGMHRRGPHASSDETIIDGDFTVVDPDGDQHAPRSDEPTAHISHDPSEKSDQK